MFKRTNDIEQIMAFHPLIESNAEAVSVLNSNRRSFSNADRILYIDKKGKWFETMVDETKWTANLCSDVGRILCIIYR